MAADFDTGLGKNQANFVALTPIDFIARAAEVYGDRLAIVHGQLRQNWRETYDRTKRLASGLQRLGVKKGDTVAVMLPNTPAMVEAHFGKSNGELYKLPIIQTTAEVVLKIPQKSELINQTSMTADEDGKPYIATYFKSFGSNVPQYQLIYFTGLAWQVKQISDRKTSFSLSGAGTKKIPISRPQIIVSTTNGRFTAIMLYRDEENGSVASALSCKDLTTNIWTTKNITTNSLDNWEPSYDTELWKQFKKLQIFIQRAGQGDGEKLENLAPQPVYVLEWKP